MGALSLMRGVLIIIRLRITALNIYLKLRSVAGMDIRLLPLPVYVTPWWKGPKASIRMGSRHYVTIPDF